MTTTKMEKAYAPDAVEQRWYAEWEARGYFHADPKSTKESYTIVIPPPNVTGVLTLGHVLNNTLQDILIRWEKMRGKEVCWVPGTDHAGIATQSKVEAALRAEESSSRFDLGREAFVQRVWNWRERYGGVIIRQLRRLGVACDWRRERFTLDEGLSSAVIEVFIRLYEKGLIYKGTRMINWCPNSLTALSDEEVIYRPTKGNLWYIRYPLADGSGSLVVATTRPETMLGDTGVAVHPDDPRFQSYIGKTVRLPLTEREIPIFADAFVDREFGTGAVKVTPAHDPNDYAMGLQHGLEMINVMNDDATMNAQAGSEFAGMDRFACRAKVIERLREQGLLVKLEDYENKVGYSERAHVPIEPRLSAQWFVRMETLARPALDAVRHGDIRFFPPRWEKTYYHWMENIKDWCISRQLWWGHRIPAYYCNNCGHIAVAKAAPLACAQCQHTAFRQDEDVLDTWFSSWLWPFSVFDWPKPNDSLARFYPTQTLVTGPDIIFFWVARMIISGLEFMQAPPFRNVYFTSIIRDDQGRKLSKSLNNSPDPLDVIAQYGADALRYTVIYIAPVGQDIRYSNEKCEIGRNFANKLWNASRFRQMFGELSLDWSHLTGLDPAKVRPDDRWVLCRADAVIGAITNSLETFDFHAYSIQLYEFVWNEFCDWYVESVKAALHGTDSDQKAVVLRVFDYVLSTILRLMHPIMPFVTEEIYHALGFVADADSIMLASWPARLSAADAAALRLTGKIETLVQEKFDLIKAGRNLRSAYNIPFSKKIQYVIRATDTEFAALLAEDMSSFVALLNASDVRVDAQYEHGGAIPSAVGKYGIVYMPLDGAIDVAAETARLTRQQEEYQRVLAGIDAKLANDKFLAKAPESVVQKERERRQEFLGRLAQLQALLANWGPEAAESTSAQK